MTVGVSSVLRDLTEEVLELLFPTRCSGCDLPGSLLCQACADQIPLISPHRSCPRCGAPRRGSERCRECPSFKPAFGALRCLSVLEHPLSRAITVYKDGGEPRLAGVLGGLLAETCVEWAEWADAVAYVPASRAARGRRGFDHTAGLAARVSAAWDVPLAHAIVRLRGGDQRRLGKGDRRAAVSQAFAASVARVPARVVLVDDVVTTCATVDACARVLLEGGCAEVRVLALARACGGGGPRA